MKKTISLLLMTVILANLVTSCKKKPGPAPELPPEASMLIDFTNFESGKKSADFLTLSKGVENSNWEFAAFVAWTWDALIVNTLAVPVAAFKLAIDQTPTYLEEKTWQWSFNVTVLAVTYKARLTGEKRTSDVQWKMYITKEGGTESFAEFLWFEGTSSSTGGQWILNHSSKYKEPVLQIDYTLSSGTVQKITYTYIRALNDNREADPYKTSYIEYGKTAGTSYPLDAYYTVKVYHPTLKTFANVKIEWNITSHQGRVQCSEYFGNTNWNCWNSSLVNVVCP
jgi:hypothetical protein